MSLSGRASPDASSSTPRRFALADAIAGLRGGGDDLAGLAGLAGPDGLAGLAGAGAVGLVLLAAGVVGYRRRRALTADS